MLKTKNRSISPCTKLTSKWIEDLNIRSDILNLIEEKVENRMAFIDLRMDFAQDATVQALWPTTNKWELMKLRRSGEQKNPIIRARL